MSESTFAHLGLPKPLVAELTKQGITEPFPIQAASIPDALDGRDISGKAPTGSGKTLAFGLPLLTRVGRGRKHQPKALILAPTRELAEQIKLDLAPLAKAAQRKIYAIYGGVSYGPQKGILGKGVDILVATPGRLEDLIDQRHVELSDVDHVIVDEADRMADMGFMPAVKRILDQTSKDRQTVLFSATLDGDVAELTRRYQTNPVLHEAESMDDDAGAGEARHHFWRVPSDQRVGHTAEIASTTGRTIVFTRTRHGADRLAKQLAREGVSAVAMHGGRSQNQRNRALREFSSGRARALIATDVAARGIHVDAVASVVHYDLPADHKDYLHRSGRTARAGASGTVVTLVPPNQQRKAKRLQKELGMHPQLDEPRMDELEAAPMPQPSPRPAAERPDSKPSKDRRPRESKPRRRASHDGPSLYVANLPWQVTNRDVVELFKPFGKVRNATIITDNRSGRSKGFGFVDMPQEDAERAIGALHGFDFAGRDLTVRFAKPSKWHKG